MSLDRYTKAGTVLAVFFSAIAGGCGANNFGESVAISRQKPMAIGDGLGSGETLVLPGGEPFNVTEMQRHSSGAGQSQSSAAEDGTASCQAGASASGEASSEFQLGHVLHNSADQPIEAIVRFDCEFDYSVTGPDPSRAPDLLALKLYIQDSNRVMIHKETLVTRSDALGAQSRTGRESPSFNITMQPKVAYLLVLAGKVEVRLEDDEASLDAGINVKKLEIEIHAR